MKSSKKEYNAVKAIQAMEALSREAEKNGTAEMTLEEINQEIEAARSKKEGQKKY